MQGQWVCRARILSTAIIVAGQLFGAALALPAQNLVTVEPVQHTPAEQATAQKQVDQQLQQRLLGLVPNYFVVYTPTPVPLSSRQKFQLAFRKSIDPMTFVGAGVSGAWSQMKNDPPNFPQ